MTKKLPHILYLVHYIAILLLQLQQAPRLPDLRRPAPDRRLRQRVRSAERVRRRSALLVSTHLPLLYPPTQGEREGERV